MSAIEFAYLSSCLKALGQPTEEMLAYIELYHETAPIDIEDADNSRDLQAHVTVASECLAHLTIEQVKAGAGRFNTAMMVDLGMRCDMITNPCSATCDHLILENTMAVKLKRMRTPLLRSGN